MKVEILKLYRSDKRKDGTPLITKDGRPYTKISFQCKEYGSKWLNGFGSGWNYNWKIGDIVDVDAIPYGENFDFRRPDPLKALELRVAELEKWRDGMEENEAIAEAIPEAPEEEIDLSQIPF